MTDTTTMEQFWKDKYTETDKERYNYLSMASKMTGYFTAMAKYNSSIPKQGRIRMLKYVIELWNDVNPNSELTQEWIAGWEKEIENLSK